MDCSHLVSWFYSADTIRGTLMSVERSMQAYVRAAAAYRTPRATTLEIVIVNDASDDRMCSLF